MSTLDEFWKNFLNKAAPSIPLYRGVTPKPNKGWLSTKRESYPFCTVVKEHASHVEICFQGKTEMESNQKFDQLFARKESIERYFGEKLRWERLPEKKRSKIMSVPIPLGSLDRNHWGDLINQLVDKMSRFIMATEGPGSPIIQPKNTGGYTPSENDYDFALRQLDTPGKEIPISMVEDQIEKNMIEKKIVLNPDWRMDNK